MVVLDTNILIDYLRRPKNTDSHLVKLADSHPKETFSISTITLQELYSGQSSKVASQEHEFLNIISNFRILIYSEAVAKLAGQIERDLGRPIEFPDAAIAATTIINKASLATLNKKDFQDIADLEFV